MSKYICKNCNTNQDAKHIDAMSKAGFGLQHLACSECGQNMIAAKNEAAMALGKLGGSVKSEAKAAAVRANGAKGGRPKSERQYRIEGVVTTRWYSSREAAWDAYQTASERKGYDTTWHCPGEAAGDVWDGATGYGTPGAVHGIRDGHKTITLRIK